MLPVRRIRTLLVTDERDLQPHLAAWCELADLRRRPYCRPEWMLAWWRHLSPAGSLLRTVLVLDGERPVGVAPYYAAPGRAGRVDYRLLAAGFSHPLDLLAEPSYEDDVASAVARSLAEARPSASLVTFEGLDEHSGWPAALRAAWPGPVRPGRYRTGRMVTPRLELPPVDYETWMGSKSSNFRHQMRRLRRKFAAAGGTTYIAAGEEAIARSAQAFAAMHDARWEQRGGSSLEAGGTARMLTEAALALGPERLRLWTAELDGRVVAVQVFAATGGEICFFNSGWDERHADFKPSMVGILAAIEDALARGDRRIDFGAGTQPYKLRFAEDTSSGVTWSGLFPVDRRYPVTRVQLAPQQIEWWARRRARALPPERRERLERVRDRVQGRLHRGR
jgi:CelD/BcsL family acetyltransferase involved in cellulose biosynthesis